MVWLVLFHFILLIDLKEVKFICLSIDFFGRQSQLKEVFDSLSLKFSRPSMKNLLRRFLWQIFDFLLDMFTNCDYSIHTNLDGYFHRDNVSFSFLHELLSTYVLLIFTFNLQHIRNDPYLTGWMFQFSKKNDLKMIYCRNYFLFLAFCFNLSLLLVT